MSRSRRRRDVPRRRVVFVGVEGKSDRAFARFLGLLCDQAGLHVHIDAKPCNEARRVPARDAVNQLRKLWPTYSKSSLTADQLRQRFALGDLDRAARHDEELRNLLLVLGLVRQG